MNLFKNLLAFHHHHTKDRNHFTESSSAGPMVGALSVHPSCMKTLYYYPYIHLHVTAESLVQTHRRSLWERVEASQPPYLALKLDACQQDLKQ